MERKTITLPQTCDFRVIDHGTVKTIIAVSDDAKAYANDVWKDGIADWMGTPERFTTDWRPANYIVGRLRDDGFDVKD